jgi:hypothetical protein
LYIIFYNEFLNIRTCTIPPALVHTVTSYQICEILAFHLNYFEILIVREAGYPQISIAKPSKCKNQYYVHVFIIRASELLWIVCSTYDHNQKTELKAVIYTRICSSSNCADQGHRRQIKHVFMFLIIKVSERKKLLTRTSQ